MHRSIPIRTAVTLLLVFTAGAVHARRVPSGPSPGFGQPLILRLEGVIEPTAAAAKETGGFTVTSFGFIGEPGAHRWLGVTKVRTVGGDQPLDGTDVLAIVDPFDPNLLVAGPADMVAELRDAPAGTALQVEGLVERASRVFYLRAVQRADGDRG